tara:strand:- start:515 stop:7468 length:6954 start_codon:yes stop_codon:yes gene_type:complete
MKNRLLFVFSLYSLLSWGQGTITTSPPLIADNQSTGVSFRIETGGSPVEITGISNIFQSGTSATIWVRQGGVTSAGAPTIDAANGWTALVQNAPISPLGGSSPPVVIPFGGLKIPIAANSAIGVYIETSGGNTHYQTGTSSDPLTYTDGTLTVSVADSLAFGGSFPNPTFNPRRFLGSVSYDLAITGACTNLFSNFNIGNITINSADINWTPGTGNTGFRLEYGLAGFTQGTGIVISGTYPTNNPPINISSLIPDSDYEVYFTEYCGVDSIYFPGPQTFRTLPTCPAVNPSTVNVSLLGSDVFLNWRGTGSNPGAFVQYGSSGFNLGSGTTTFVPDTFATITGLSDDLVYDFYVRDSCGTNDFSRWVGPFSIRTRCNDPLPLNLPFSEGFESFSVGPTFNGTTNLCATNYDWRFDASDETLSRLRLQAGSSFYRNGTQALTLDHSPSATNIESNFLTLTVNLSNYSTVGGIQLSFYFMSHGQENHPDNRVWVRGGPADPWVEILNLDAIRTANGVFDSVKDVDIVAPIVSAGQSIGALTQIRFGQNGRLSATSTTASDGLTIDDISLKAVTCPLPLGLAVNNLVDTAATLDWTGSASASQFQYWFGPAGFYQGSTTMAGVKAFASSGGIVVDTLTSQVCYEFLVRAVCGAGDTSDWVGPVSFCTPCPPITAPYTQNFDNTSEPAVDACWTVINNGSSTSSFVGTENFLSSSAPNSLEMYYFTGSGELMIATPLLIDFDNAKRIRFETYDENQTSDLIIGTMSDPSDVTTFTPYDTIFAADMADDAWDPQQVLFNNYTGTDKYVAFAHGQNNILDQIYIDNFIYESPTCFDPSNLMVNSSTNTSVDLSWTTGGASNWQIEYGPLGFTPGTGTIIPASSSTNFTVSGLTAGTPYEFYVRDSCGTGDVSLWEGPKIGVTTCASALSGTYTIGGTSANFATFEEAAQALNVCGVSGPVTLNVQPNASGTPYTGSFHLLGVPGLYSGVPGASITNTITVNGGGATLDFNQQGPQATVLIDSTDYVTIDNLTITNNAASEGWGILVTNDADHFTLTNSVVATDSSGAFRGDVSPIAISSDYENDQSFGSAVDSVTIENCHLVGGYYGLTYYGNSTVQNVSGFTLRNTNIRKFYLSAMYLYSVENVEITDNTIVSNISATDEDGIYLIDVDHFQISGNQVHVKDYGIYINDGNDGLSPATNSTLYNNMVISENDYGIYLLDAIHIDVYHNSSMGNPAFAIDDDEELNIYNNIFVSNGSDFAFESVDPIDATSLVDYNIYFKVSGGDLIDDGNATFTDLSSWQTADATRNTNSLEGDPVFIAIDDLHLLGGLANDAGDNTLGITVDIDGDTRPAAGSTTVDIGADEYTPLAGDIAILSGDFIKGLCLSANDSIVLTAQNLITNIDFSVDPLTASYSVTGPANSSGLITVNTGVAGVLDTIIMKTNGIDLSIPGVYTLNAYLQQNGVNVVNSNDTLASVTFEVKEEFIASPDTAYLLSQADSVEICVNSSFFGAGDFKITEICHFAGATNGTPTAGRPGYLTADDYIEISGAPGSDLEGYTLEQWSASALLSTETFAAGTVLSPSGNAILAISQLNSSVPSPSDFYYHANGAFTGTNGSGTAAGRILKDDQGNIIDAVGYGTSSYSFPAAAGVTTEWNGGQPSGSSTWGIRLEGPDTDDGTNWVASSTSPQDPNVYNTGFPVINAAAAPGLNWTLAGSTAIIDTTSCIVVGPYTNPGNYQYVVSFSNACGSYTDTVTVVVPNCSAPSVLRGEAVSASSVAIAWDTVGTGSTSFDVEYGPVGFTVGAGTRVNVSTDSTVVTGIPTNLCAEYYVRSTCSPTDASVWAGPIQICPDQTICGEDIEQYATGLIENQSALFLPWQGTVGAGGTASVVTTQAASGNQSLMLSDPTGTAPDDIIAYFDTISSGIWEVAFEMYIPSGRNAYFNIQQNHAFNGVGTNYWGGEVYFQGNGTAEVQYSTGTVVAGTFSYTQGQWNSVSTILDLDNDSIWFELNGTSTGIGYDYSLANPGVALQFNGVNFYTGKIVGDPTSSEYYIDDFCVQPYAVQGICNPPNALSVTSTGCDSISLNWTSLSGGSIIEYGVSPLTPGTGSFTGVVVPPYTISGLNPGTQYDVLIADTCTGDTSTFTSINGTTKVGPTPNASFSIDSAIVNGSYEVYLDASGSTNALSYSWDFGNSVTSSNIVDTATYGTNGSYTITLVVSNTCGTDTATFTTNANVDLVENALANSLSVYPNPTQKMLNVSFREVGSADVQIVLRDAQGRSVLMINDRMQSGTYSNAFNVSDLASGIYMLEIKSGSLTAHRRISIK